MQKNDKEKLIRRDILCNWKFSPYLLQIFEIRLDSVTLPATDSPQLIYLNIAWGGPFLHITGSRDPVGTGFYLPNLSAEYW